MGKARHICVVCRLGIPGEWPYRINDKYLCNSCRGNFKIYIDGTPHLRWSHTTIRKLAEKRVHDTPQLEEHQTTILRGRVTLLTDWAESDQHWVWVLTARIPKIVKWAREVEEDIREEMNLRFGDGDDGRREVDERTRETLYGGDKLPRANMLTFEDAPLPIYNYQQTGDQGN